MKYPFQVKKKFFFEMNAWDRYANAGDFAEHGDYGRGLRPHQRSTCSEEKVRSAASRVKSLKPHCVSRMPRTQRNQTRKWKPCIRKLRNSER